MATITPYETASGRRYRVRYRKPDRTQTDKRGFKTKREAELFAATVAVLKATGDYVDPSLGRTTVAAIGDAWIAAQLHLKPASRVAMEGSWRTHVKPKWGTRQIASITFSEVQAWVAELSTGIPGAREGEWERKPKSASTVNRAHGVLSSILDVAARDRLISSNAARGVKLPRKVRRSHAYLTHAQVAHLARESRAHSTLVNALAYTGLRWGEITGLRVIDCDFMRGRVRVTQNAVTVSGQLVVGTPKTHRARSVPIPSFLREEFAELAVGKELDSPLFGTGAAHLPVSASKRGWFAEAVKRCQAADPTFPRVTPHDLRHTAASLAIASGANVKAVQRMLGHASAAMTLDVYADLFDDDLDLVASALDQARRAHILPTLEQPGPPSTPPHTPSKVA
ncbi:site-specific integrase [Leucobacter chromiiresistens]|uniref:Site-specific recombinase XerD n=1 Tax=Leucobacter chromiiresistens TaxID=1079994 RepID=A0A1H0XQ28_9MICO|nr:site-specific integrase [Leucobacter chromiiresistens]SDQ04909.1 Site-specific recombinase XerD [Leucobacter chromiiresistens]SDQ48048.1 Site-specific recombinase XerD [Leucobacter chromiiresistens]